IGEHTSELQSRPHLVCRLFFRSESVVRSEEHTSELQSRPHVVCRLLLEKSGSTAGATVRSAWLWPERYRSLLVLRLRPRTGQFFSNGGGPAEIYIVHRPDRIGI